MNIRVFIQNEAGSNRKHYHDEKTLEWKRVEELPRHYPYAYGFVVGTTGDDGCNVDCYVITEESLKSGALVECEVAGLMEQFEEAEEDHKVLATLPGASIEVSPAIRERLTEFVYSVFEQLGDTRVVVGRFLGPVAAATYVTARRDPM
jgi:inorganic pyrophosphatase